MEQLRKIFSETYYLFHYALASEGGKATQRSRTCGQDYTIEEAFAAARSMVLQDYARLGRELEKGGEGAALNLRIRETEFGYDLAQGHRVVSRYWIHPKTTAA